MSPKRTFNIEEAEEIGLVLGIDWKQVNLNEFRRGLEVELEHGARDPETNVTGDDLQLTGKIAWAHLTARAGPSKVAKKPSPVVFTIRPACSLILGSITSRRSAFSAANVPLSSRPMRRE